MSFSECGATIKAGDVAIVYLSHDTMIPVTVKRDEISQTKYGAMKHNDLIGHSYGKKFSCSKVSFIFSRPVVLVLSHMIGIGSCRVF